jgi:GNAT superfamily N-acetyltransferase
MDKTHTQVEIAQATCENEIREVARLFDLYRVFYKQRSDVDASYRFVYDRWVARESVIFVARIEKLANGFVQLYPSFDSSRMKQFWILNDLYVVEEARRFGIGRALMRRAEQHARETKSAGLMLGTAVDNLKAQALYEGEGYVRDSGFLYYVKSL